MAGDRWERRSTAGRARDERPPEHEVLGDYPVGPDDLGNAVVHGIAFIQRGWRRIADMARRRARGR